MTDVKHFHGHFLVWALNQKGFRRKVGGSKLPYIRHERLADAVGTAELLNRQFPETTFVVIQEVARVKSSAARAAPPAAAEMEMTNG